MPKKPHKHAGDGLEADTSLSVEQVSNMAQRAADESRGDLFNGHMKIVSTRSGLDEIEFRINDFLISYAKKLVFRLVVRRVDDRTQVSSVIDWYLTLQSTVALIPVGPKKMVGHHVYKEFVENLAAQIHAADPAARIVVRVRGEAPAPAGVVEADGAQELAPPPPPPTPSAGAVGVAPPPPPPPPVAAAPAVPTFAAPPPPPPPAPPVVAPAPPVTPPPPVTPTSSVAAPPPPPVHAPTTGLVTGVPGMASSTAPPPPPTPVVPPQAAPVPAPAPPLAPAAPAAQPASPTPVVPAHDDIDDATSIAVSHTWSLAAPGGQALQLGVSTVIGRDPAAPAGSSGVVELPVDDTTRSMSKTHASLVAQGGLLWVNDLHSTNGTTVVNLARESFACLPDVPVPVDDGWMIRFGTYETRVARQES